MKRRTKKLLSGGIIFAVTLLSGFGITLISFNIFDSLTLNQMRILFAIDVICLLIAGSAVYAVDEHKKNKKAKEKIFQEVHFQRIMERQARFKEIQEVIDSANSAA